MKKPLITLVAITFAAIPALSGAANADTVKAVKPLTTYKVKLLKPSEQKFGLEFATKEKANLPFKYDGPREAFFINGIN